MGGAGRRHSADRSGLFANGHRGGNGGSGANGHAPADGYGHADARAHARPASHCHRCRATDHRRPAHPGASADSRPYPGACGHAYVYTCADRNAGANDYSDTDGYAATHTHANPYTHANAVAHRYANTYAYAYTRAHRNPNAGAHRDADAYTCANADARSCANGCPAGRENSLPGSYPGAQHFRNRAGRRRVNHYVARHPIRRQRCSLRSRRA